MRGFSKKMLISILTSVVVFVTMIATTFAWVGIFTYANTDTFNLNLKVQQLDSNYFLTICATENGRYEFEANLTDIQKSILKNQHKWTDSYIDSFGSEIAGLFKRNSITTPSTTTIVDNALTNFKSVDMATTDHFTYYEAKVPYLKFDLYLSVDTKEGIQDTSIINSDIYLTQLDNLLEGTIGEYKVYNRNPFNNLPSANEILKTIPDYSTFKINSKNACRVALSMYEPIEFSDSYNDTLVPIKTLIYQGGTQNPSLDGEVYNLGGNLPEDSNTALRELLVIRPDYKKTNIIDYREFYEDSLQQAILRGETDLEINEENSKIWSKPSTPEKYQKDDITTYNYLGVQNGIRTKMKICVYFWFEGWDADCLAGIDKKAVNLNLTFTAGTNE